MMERISLNGLIYLFWESLSSQQKSRDKNKSYGQKNKKQNEVMAGSTEVQKVFSDVSRFGKSNSFDLDGSLPCSHLPLTEYEEEYSSTSSSAKEGLNHHISPWIITAPSISRDDTGKVDLNMRIKTIINYMIT